MARLANEENEIVLDELGDFSPISNVPSRPSSKKRTEKIELRVSHQPGFVLHSYPYKETSLIVDLFSRDYGRIALVAKGAKRPHSRLRSVLQTFQPLNVAWSGRAEVKTMTNAEWVGGMLPVEKSALLCGFYLNELLTKFLIRGEPAPSLFQDYVSTLNQLAHGASAAIALRQFEIALLQQAGLLGDLNFCTVSGAQVREQLRYIVNPEAGVQPAQISESGPVVIGKTLRDMSVKDYADPTTQAQSKQLMRYLLQYHLQGQTLKTRQILIDLQKL